MFRFLRFKESMPLTALSHRLVSLSKGVVLVLFMLFITQQSKAQTTSNNTITVSGKISDDTGPIPGASVYLKTNKMVAVVSDSAGVYSIKVPSNGVLVFSYIGFRSQEIEIKGETTLNVTLITESNTVEEVAIVAYGKQKKATLVGAVSTVTLSDVKMAVPRSLTNALAGKVSGIIAVQRSGEPGNDDAQFFIRGISTLGAGREPLILVDGVERPIGNIEPEDIENFSVLKDAAATSVYGIRGANGVVLVSTRRGANQKANINFKLETISKSATRRQEFVDGATFMELFNEANKNTNPALTIPVYSQDIINKTRSLEDPFLYPSVNWYDMLVAKSSPSNRGTLNVSGGSDVAKYYISGSYLNESGLWKTDNLNSYNTNAKLKRYNFRANTDVRLSKRTDITLGLGGYLVNVDYPGRASDALYNLVFKASPVQFPAYYPDPNNPDGKLFASRINDDQVRNPYQDLVNTGFQSTFNNALQADVTVKHDLGYVAPGLKFQGLFAFDTYSHNELIRTRDRGDRYQATGRDSNGDLILQSVSGQQDLGFAKGSGGNRRVYAQAALNYDREFGSHRIGGLLLYNQQDYVNADAGSNLDALPFRYQGLVGRLSYNYKSRYLAELSAGYNGSENFEKGKRFGLFPALGLGWVISDETFFKNNINFIDFLKFRGSFGLKGNDQLGGRRFGYLTTVGGGNGGYTFGKDYNTNLGGRGEDLYGSDLTWEREQEINLGFELRVLKGLTVQADIFNRRRKNILLQRQSLPFIFGVSNLPFANIGEFNNKGIDASFEYSKRLGDFNISFRGNFTYTRNKIIENDQPDYQYTYQNRKGLRLDQPFGFVDAGLYTNDDFMDLTNYILKPSLPTSGFGKVYPGDIKYVDINGDGRIDDFDQVAIGNPPIPSVIYGFGTALQFKNFDIAVFFQGAGGMDFMAGVFPFLEGNNTNVQLSVLDRWTPENPSQDVLFPRLTVGANQNNTRESTFYQRDASYLRLKSAEIGYTLPGRLTQKIGVGAFRIYVSGLNLLTFSKFKYWDPELGPSVQGTTGAKYPIQKTYNVGINVNF